MIIRENIIEVTEQDLTYLLDREDFKYKPEELIFFDLEHYVYKKPKCVGVFGACVYNKNDNKLYVTQYMIENKNEVVDILMLAKKYFINMKKLGKKVIVTFSGNNDFTVINYLFNRFNIQYNILGEFEELDIQKQYEKEKNTSIGLKNLEKEFQIFRGSELISGSNLAKTFHKILKDKEYILRMPKEKIEVILLYNEQDVVSLYSIFTSWKKFINPYTEDVDGDSDEVSEEVIQDVSEDISEEINDNIESEEAILENIDEDSIQ